MTDKDKIMHKALIKILNDADFTLKMREVSTFIEVYKWVQEMPQNWKKPAPVKEEKPKVTRKKKS